MSPVARLHIRELAVFGLLAALLCVSKFALSGLPNIEPVSLLLILYTLSYGKKALYILYAWVLFEGLLYGFGQWFFSYLYVWLALWGLAMLFRRRRGAVFWAVVSGFYGLLFGPLCALSWGVLHGPAAGFSYWVSGIPFDIAHAVGNFILALLLFRPLRRAMDMVSRKLRP